MSKPKFNLILLLIVIGGLFLRFHDYDRLPPWRESDDEIHYAWTGLTWLTSGVPTSWSWLSSYATYEEYNAWRIKWRLVSPMLEKPPLYSLLSGGLELLFGHSQLSEVRLTTIRLLPITLGVISILLTGIVAAQIFSPAVGLVSALLYASVPTIVMGNRVSVTENLITPLSLLSLITFLTHSTSIRFNPEHVEGLTQKKSKSWEIQQALLLGLIGGVATLTKQIGVTVLIVPIVLFLIQRKWKPLFIVTLIGAIFFLMYPLIGAFYDWSLFRSLLVELRRVGVQGGLPQLLQTILARPLIGTEKLFPDGTVLLGYLLLFTSPFWLLNQKLGKWKKQAFLAFPFAYLVYLALIITGAEPIGSGQGFWGWYVFPLFPYLTILVAYALYDLWKNYSIMKSIILFLILGSSTIRFLFLFLPREKHYLWQYTLLLLLGIILSAGFVRSLKYRKLVLLALFGLLVAVNIYTGINLAQIYPNVPQPSP